METYCLNDKKYCEQNSFVKRTKKNRLVLTSI